MPDPLSQTFAALADPTRRAMLARLSHGEANVTELAGPFLNHMSLPAVTKHLKVLERAGLITKTREAQWRPCRLNGDAFKDVADWMEQYRAFWEESFDRLEEYLKTVTAKKTAGGGIATTAKVAGARGKAVAPKKAATMQSRVAAKKKVTKKETVAGKKSVASNKKRKKS